MASTSTPRRGRARQRLIDAALDLFAEHGVNGTSLQMIADALGVTKAAVYHQFHTKDEIVAAVLEDPFAQLADVVERAERATTRRSQLDRLIDGLVEVVVQHRRMVAAVQGDPGMARFMKEHEPFLHVIERLELLLTGPSPDAEVRVAAAMFGGGILSAGAHPLLVDLDDDTLQDHLRLAAHRILDLPTH